MRYLPRLFAGILIFSSVACHLSEKTEVPVEWEHSNQRLEVEGREVLTFTLPGNFQHGKPTISGPPSKASLVEIKENEEGKWTLAYKSANGVSGEDQLTIDSESSYNDHLTQNEHSLGGTGFSQKSRENKQNPKQYRLHVSIQIINPAARTE